MKTWNGMGWTISGCENCQSRIGDYCPKRMRVLSELRVRTYTCADYKSIEELKEQIEWSIK